VDGNLSSIRGELARAEEAGADLCLFPELCLTGYPPLDLLERPRFIRRCREALEELATTVGKTGAIVGFIDRNMGDTGKPLHNAAALLADGRIVSVHHKVLLPTYDVFDEHRYFTPGGPVQVVEYGGLKLGISICEDAWSKAELPSEPRYVRDPLQELVDAGADVLINISASPFTLTKRRQRPQMMRDNAARLSRPLLYVNQVGGNDELLFDGHSLAAGPDGSLWARCHEFEEDLRLVDVTAGSGTVAELLPGEESAVIAGLARGTRDYAHRCGFKTALVGLSGGIDSALVATLAARALGPHNVWGVAMPTRYSSEGSLNDAQALAGNLGIHYRVFGIDGLFQQFTDELSPLFEGKPADVTEENLQARIRAVVLMSLSNKHGHLLLTTGNKSEVATGYCTLYGDMAGGLAVIADLPKTLVYRVAEQFNVGGEVIPAAIIHKPPSAELAPDQKDSDSLPPYDVLDQILHFHVERGEDTQAIVARGFDADVVQQVTRLVRIAEYKRRQAPPVLKITSKAFGGGRRMPIAQGWWGS